MKTAIAARPARQRLDLLLVHRGLARSRAVAQALVMSGRVSVAGRTVDKAGQLVAEDAELRVAPAAREYASRGGHKLAGALDAFSLDVRDARALDVGASTGGFTDCLLQRHAAHVVALDVGKGQLDWRLRNDARVTVIEGVNARALVPDDLPVSHRVFDLVTVDVSFISLRLVLAPLLPILHSEGSLVALIKPQFEVGRGQVGKGGIVRDAALRAGALATVATGTADLGFAVRGLTASPLAGMEGNQEYFMLADPRPGGLSTREIEALAEEIAFPQD